MVNTIQKMHRSNAKAKKWLLSHGYADIYMFPHSRFNKGWNIDKEEFDGICIDYTSNPHVILFQVKSNGKIPKLTLDKYRCISKDLNVRCLWVNAMDRNKIEVYE